MAEWGGTSVHDDVVRIIANHIYKQCGICVNFKQQLLDNITHLSMTMWKDFKDEYKLAQHIFNEYFSLEGYSPKDIHYLLDENLDLPTTWGFIMTEDGKIHHLMHQYNHGVVLASLYPHDALKCGYMAPPMKAKRGLLSVYDYQDFELRDCRDKGVIRVASGYWNRISFSNEKINEVQVKNLKLWLTNMSMMDDTVVTDIGDMTYRKVLTEMDKIVTTRKLNPEPDYTLIEPEGFGA